MGNFSSNFSQGFGKGFDLGFLGDANNVIYFTKSAGCPSAPDIIADDADDSDFSWKDPAGSVFFGKAPDVANFSAAGTYELRSLKWDKVTQLDFSSTNMTDYQYLLLKYLEYFYFQSNSGLSSDVSGWSLPSSLVNLYLYNTSVSGDISGWSLPSSLVTLYLRNTSVSGDISGWSLPSSLVNLYLQNASVSGDISGWSLPSSLVNLSIYNNPILEYGNDGSFESATNNVNIRIDNCALLIAEVDRALADLVTSGATNGTLNIGGTNDSPTGGATNADYLTLVSRGWTVTIS